MATMYRCDRCGTVSLMKSDTQRLQLTRIGTGWDLCRKCVKEFKEWIKPENSDSLEEFRKTLGKGEEK